MTPLRTTILVSTLAVAAGCGPSSVYMRPESVRMAPDGTQVFHFQYDASCLDLALGGGWRLATGPRHDRMNNTKFFAPRPSHSAVALQRFPLGKGETLETFATAFLKKRMDALNNERDMDRAMGVHANQRMTFDPNDLTPFAVGRAPLTHPGLLWTFDRRNVTYASSSTHTLYMTFTQYRITTHEPLIHLNVFFVDGASGFRLAINVPAKEWESFKDEAQRVTEGVLVGSCNAPPPPVAPVAPAAQAEPPPPAPSDPPPAAPAQ